MPLYKSIAFSENTHILIWHITETVEELAHKLQLNDNSTKRLLGMKAVSHQKGFLSVRKLLQIAGYSDFDLYYDPSGKPNLTDGKHISISHSHEFATIVIGTTVGGIDIEKHKEKTILIADKFVTESENLFLNKQDKWDYVKQITVIWGAKEAVFKICNEPGISFKEHVYVNPFDSSVSQTTACLEFKDSKTVYNIYYEDFEGFSLVYAYS